MNKFMQSAIIFLRSHKMKASNERKKVIDWFCIVCWICAIAMAILVCLKIPLSNSELILIGATIGLILLPFASKFKFFGFEFVRLSKMAKSDEKD